MREFFASVWQQIRDFIAGLTPKERIRLLVMAVIIVLLSVAAAYMLGRTEYDVLYTGIAAAKAGEIVTALEEMGVPYKTQGSDTVLIPRDQVSEVRMRLSADKVAPGIAATPDIYSSLGGGFGTTDEERNTYLRYQTQSDLRTAINQIDKVEDSMVFLNLPKSSSVVLANSTPATASVQVKLRQNEILTDLEATAIGEMVADSVGLELDNITVLDTRMKVYTMGFQESSAIGVAKQMELERQMRVQLENNVIALLSPVFGAANISITASVALNFDRETVSSVEFAPPAGREEGLVVSLSELFEFAHGEYFDGGIPGTDSNGMGTAWYPYGEVTDPEEHYHRILREMNLEIDETRTEIERAQGTIRNLSIAVLLNSHEIDEESGIDYINTVKDLVSKAIGVTDTLVSVQQLPFSDLNDANPFEQQQAFEKRQERQMYIRMGLNFLIVVLLIAAIFLMVRMILKARADRQRVILATTDGTGRSVDYLADGSLDGAEGGDGLQDINISSKTEGVLQLEKLIDKDPEAVAQLLRNWLSDDYR